jgi:CHAT domain-containing protein/tetratricopeptide (TPR) repeat protein
MKRSLNTGDNAPGPELPKKAERPHQKAFHLRNEEKLDAILLMKRSLHMSEKALGPEHPKVATLLNKLADLYYDKRDYLSAEPLYQRSLAIQEKVLGPEHTDTVASLNDLARLYMSKGDYLRAEPLYQRSLTIRKKVLGPAHIDTLTSIENLASCYRRRGDYARAALYYRRSLNIREKALGREHPDVADSLNNLALVYTEKAEYLRAEPLYLRSIDILKKKFGSEHRALARPLNNLALLYRNKGDYERADALSRRSLAILEKALGPKHLYFAASLHNRAQLFMDNGNYVVAESLVQRSLAIFEKALGPEHPDVATSLNCLGGIYDRKGDIERAESLYQRALRIREKALGMEHPSLTGSLNNLAALYEKRGDYARAEPLFQRALTICENALGPDHPHTATSLNNLANLHSDTHDYARAEPIYQRVLEIRERTLGPKHPSTATSLSNLAVIYEVKGDYVRAEALHQRALAIRENVFGTEHPEVAISLHRLSMIYLTRREVSSALRFMARHNEIQEHNTMRELTVGSDAQRRAYINNLGSPADTAISLHVQFAPDTNAAKELALTEILRRKGRVLDAMTDSFASLRGKIKPADQAQFDQWRSITAQQAALALRGAGSVPLDQYRINLNQLNAARLDLENKLSFRSVGARSVLKPVRLEPVRASIPEATLLVELFRYKPLKLSSVGFRYTFGTPRYIAYLLNHDGMISWADLGDAEPIEAAATELLSALRRDAADAGPPARKLDALVMEPIRHLLGNTRRVFLSPDGALNLVPFNALMDEQGHYSIERYSFTYLTSGRELLRLTSTERPRQGPFIAVAPDFGEMVASTASSTAAHATMHTESNGNQRSADLGNWTFGPLPAAAHEGYTIRQRLRDAILVSGADATEDAIKALHGPSVLHIATHGFFLPDQKQIQQHTVNGFESAFRSVPSENSLLRSGLAFAGANPRRSGTNDGILTALEASHLDLVGTKLVVLSACDTGVGEAVGGEGVYGLRRSIAMAGAETQVMSLWKVDDRATRELMEAYYDGLLAGGGRSEAMRQAQLAMLHRPNRASPYYWASFIVLGNPAPLDMDSLIPDLTKVKPGVRGCGCEMATKRRGYSEVWAGIVAWLSLLRRRPLRVRGLPAFCRRLVRRPGYRAYSTEVANP